MDISNIDDGIKDIYIFLISIYSWNCFKNNTIMHFYKHCPTTPSETLIKQCA